MLRHPAFLSCALLVPLCSAAQSASEVEAKFIALANKTRLTDPALKPWHLKLSFNQTATKEHPADSGVIEEWWASPDQYRIRLNSALYTGTTTRNGTTLARTTGIDGMPALDVDLLGLITGPLPSQERIRKFPATFVKRPAGKAQLDCFVLGSAGKTKSPNRFGTFPTFCNLPDSPGLTVLYRWQDETVVINRAGKFQEKVVPTEIDLLDFGVPVAHAHVEELGTFSPSPSEFIPDASETRLNLAIENDPYDLPRKLLTKVPPEYPESARQARITGTVVLAAVIREDGHVDSVSVLHSSDPELSKAAIAALRKWAYIPEAQNGRPVQVNTTVTMNFNMSE